ncbi:MAG: LysR family transcriptional regulator, partial [Microcoleus sp. SIO2G3]|nr:LysR family transcriptional regulator [Microcoleus sp. SIO2G3]
SVIINPNRYRSKAAEAFTREILPQFATHIPSVDRTMIEPELIDSRPLEPTSSHLAGT